MQAHKIAFQGNVLHMIALLNYVEKRRCAINTFPKASGVQKNSFHKLHSAQPDERTPWEIWCRKGGGAGAA